MTATLNLKLKPFQVPNFVLADLPPGLKQDGIKELPSFPLSALDAATLTGMCDAFRDEVFRKAGKERPLIEV